MLLRKSRYSKGVWRGRKGTAALEFGLAIPFLAVLVTGIVEVGFSMYQAMQVTYAAEAGLACAAKNGWNASSIESAATGATGLTGMTATATQFCGCPSTTAIATATCGTACASGYTAGQYIKINVSLTRKSIVSAASFGLPSTVSAQAILRQN
ncbi:MAG: TadE/TadG family type IV pilus assembly protein [Rhodomicrobium sp.]